MAGVSAPVTTAVATVTAFAVPAVHGSGRLAAWPCLTQCHWCAEANLKVEIAVIVSEALPKTRPLSNPAECAEAFGDILTAIGRGELTPDEGNMIGALIERRANLFQTIELHDEIASLKAQIAAIVVTPPRPGLHVVEQASPSALGKC